MVREVESFYSLDHFLRIDDQGFDILQVRSKELAEIARYLLCRAGRAGDNGSDPVRVFVHFPKKVHLLGSSVSR